MATWTILANQQYLTGGVLEDSSWNFMLALLAALKSATGGAYTTRGSSSAGSISAFSATPDGVDRWTGKTVAEVLTSTNYAWHILEAPTSGIQVLLAIRNNGDGFMYIGVAKNKFETAGAWRNAGSVGVTTSPRDETSVPEHERDVVPTSPASISTPRPTHTGAMARFHVWKRADGEGFMVVATEQTGAEDRFYLGGIFKLVDPRAGDTNPFIVICQQGGPGGCDSDLYDVAGPGHADVFGRIPTDGIIRYSFAQLYAGERIYDRATLGPSPFSGKYQALPVVLFSRAVALTEHFRGTLTDVYRAHDSHATHDVVNAAAQIIFDDLMFPWDGTTTPLLGP